MRFKKYIHVLKYFIFQNHSSQIDLTYKSMHFETDLTENPLFIDYKIIDLSRIRSIFNNARRESCKIQAPRIKKLHINNNRFYSVIDNRR